MTTVLARAGAIPVPAVTRRQVAEAIAAAVVVLRLDQPTLAGRVQRAGATATVQGLDWGAYRIAVVQALAPARDLYASAASDQGDVASNRGMPVVLGEDGQAWTTERAELIVAGSIAALLAVAADSIRRRLNPWDTAGVLGRTTGLNRTQAVAIAAMRPAATTPAGSSVWRRTERVADQTALRYFDGRSEMIAATETHAAQVAGAVDAWRSAFLGTPVQTDFLLQWGGTASCEQCAPYDGQIAMLEDGFDDGYPPLHPHCGCSVDLVDAASVGEVAA